MHSLQKSHLTVCSCTELGNDQLVKALQAVLEDETFKFNSKVAVEARQAAVSLLEWVKNQDNQLSVTRFLQQLQKQFEGSLKFLTAGSVNRDRFW